MSTTDLTVVSPIMKRVVDGVINNTIDITDSLEEDDDSPFERSLCAAWDVCSVEEYAIAMNNTQFHRVLLKVITRTAVIIYT